MHRRNELEGRINQLAEKCDHAINQMKKIKTKAQGFVLNLNCDPPELKDRFLNSMKQLDEYMYLLTDFSLAAAQLDDSSSIENTPVLDTSHKTAAPQLTPYNLLDALSEPTPSTSTSFQSPEKTKSTKVAKEEQTLIEFSSTSCSSESVPKSEVATKEIQCNLVEDTSPEKVPVNVKSTTPGLQTVDAAVNTRQGPQSVSRSLPPQPSEPCKLPAQKMLEVDQIYTGTIMHINGPYFWVITEDIDDIYGLMMEMTEYYKQNYKELSAQEVQSLSYCAFFEDNCYYRGLFVNLTKEDKNVAEMFLVDTGETRCAPVRDVQPLAPQFCDKAPFARCCHLAGIDLLCYHDEELMEKFEEFMKQFIGRPCGIEVDDNSSESLGVYVILPNEEILNHIMVKQKLAYPTDKAAAQGDSETNIAAELDQELEITQGPEYEDPVEAVTGYHNRDEADICKHYKGGPEKTCFKGSRCTKRHVLKHPDGWTLDRVEVPVKCKQLPLPKPDTWHRVLVTCVCHYDRVYVQFVKETEREEVPEFGVILPPMNLPSLVRDMNSAAARNAYKPLQISPAPGELVAALYPFDNNWYRARVLSLTRSDQSVEVIYVDYGTTMWVKENQVRVLEPQYLALPMQAVRCALAGVVVRSHCSRQWAAAKKALSDLVQDQLVDAHVIAREYDELIVELYDDKGFSVAEQLTTLDCVELVEFEVQHDTNLPQKIVVP